MIGSGLFANDRDAASEARKRRIMEYFMAVVCGCGYIIVDVRYVCFEGKHPRKQPNEHELVALMVGLYGFLCASITSGI